MFERYMRNYTDIMGRFHGQVLSTVDDDDVQQQ